MFNKHNYYKRKRNRVPSLLIKDATTHLTHLTKLESAKWHVSL